MDELTSFLIYMTIPIIVACNSISIFALRSRIEDLEQQINKLTEMN